MTTISTHAESARESARQSNGQFGTQAHGEQDVDLSEMMSTPDVREYLVSLGHDAHVVDGMLEGIDEDAVFTPQAVQDLAAGSEAMQPTGNDVRMTTVFSNVDIKERAARIEQELLASVEQIVAEGKLRDFLDLCAANRMSSWSFGNQMLAHLQGAERRANATEEELEGCPPDLMLMSAAAWKRTYKRHPRAGAKAIWILRPNKITITEKDPDTGEEKKRSYIKGWSGQAEFDACQTTGGPIPQQELVSFSSAAPPEGAYEALKDAVGKAGYQYEEKEIPRYRPGDPTSNLGYTDPKTKTVVVDSRLPEAQKVSTLAHELGHIHCGHVDEMDDYHTRSGRSRAETEAEATAYMTMRHWGMPPSEASSFSPGYIASWSRGDPETISKAMAKATKAFQAITGLRPQAQESSS